MDSFKDIIDAVGEGNMADILGTTYSHVRTMKARNSIAPTHWMRLIEKWPAGEKPLTHADLSRIYAARSHSESSAETAA